MLPLGLRQRIIDRPTIPTVSHLVFTDTCSEDVSVEVWPQDIGEDIFAVCRLPEKKVRGTNFPTGADHEVGIRHVGFIEMGAERVDIDPVR